MREAGRLVARAHQLVHQLIEPGRSLRDLDAAIVGLYRQRGAVPVFQEFSSNQGRFPAACCISVNEQVAHAIPNDRRLQSGDLVSIDTGCRLNGWCADAAWSYPVGEVAPSRKRLIQAGLDVLGAALDQCRSSRTWSEVAHTMVSSAAQSGFSLVEEFAGHGIGRELHEDPQLRVSDTGDICLEPGLVLAIEPVVNAGSRHVRQSADGWTLETADGLPSVHFEHTIALTDGGPEVLTEGVGLPMLK